jgi:hypothetical protein
MPVVGAWHGWPDECKRLGLKVNELQTQIEASRHDVLRAQGADAAVKGVVEAVQQELALVRTELTAREVAIADLKVCVCLSVCACVWSLCACLLTVCGQRAVADERAARATEVATLQRSLDEAVRAAAMRAEEADVAHRAEVAAADEMLAAVRAGAAEARSQLQLAQTQLAVRGPLPICSTPTYPTPTVVLRPCVTTMRCRRPGPALRRSKKRHDMLDTQVPWPKPRRPRQHSV